MGNGDLMVANGDLRGCNGIYPRIFGSIYQLEIVICHSYLKLQDSTNHHSFSSR